MRTIFTDPDFTRVGYYESILREAGIAAFVRNQYSQNLLTEMPSNIFLPTLCVVNDEDYEIAMELLKPLSIPASLSSQDWVCPSCTEHNPTTFDICWKCNSERKEANS